MNERQINRFVLKNKNESGGKEKRVFGNNIFVSKEVFNVSRTADKKRFEREKI